MRATAKDNGQRSEDGAAEQLQLIFGGTVTARGDGSYVLTPAKPKALLTVSETARQLRRSVDTIYRLYRNGHLLGVRPSPNGILIEAGSVSALLERTRDPDCWSETQPA